MYFKPNIFRIFGLCAFIALMCGFTACGDKRAPENGVSANSKTTASQIEEQFFNALVNTQDLELLNWPNGGTAITSTSSPALVLDTTTVENETWDRVLLANGQMVLVRGEIPKTQMTQGVIYARSDDIGASNLPVSERGNDNFVWQDWANLPPQKAMRILKSSDEPLQETPTFVKAQGRALAVDENMETLGAPVPFFWPQIKVNNGDTQSWISLMDVKVSSSNPDNTLVFKGLINPPFLSVAINQLGLAVPDGQLTFENLAHQELATESLDAAGFSIQQALIAPEKTEISYILCLGNARGDSIYHIQWNNNVSRSIGFYDSEFRVSTPLLIGYEFIDQVESQSSTLVLDILQISGDEQSLMKVSIANSVRADQASVVNSVDF